jgi:hypothetical protein
VVVIVGLVGCGGQPQIDTHKRPSRTVHDVKQAFTSAGLSLAVASKAALPRLPSCVRSDAEAAIERVEPGTWLRVQGLPPKNFVMILVGSKNPGGVNGEGCQDEHEADAIEKTVKSKPDANGVFPLIPNPTPLYTYGQNGNIVTVHHLTDDEIVQYGKAMALLFPYKPSSG